MTETVKGEEQLLFEKRLKRLGFFILENRKLRENMIKMLQKHKGGGYVELGRTSHAVPRCRNVITSVRTGRILLQNEQMKVL